MWTRPSPDAPAVCPGRSAQRYAAEPCPCGDMGTSVLVAYPVRRHHRCPAGLYRPAGLVRFALGGRERHAHPRGVAGAASAGVTVPSMEMDHTRMEITEALRAMIKRWGKPGHIALLEVALIVTASGCG